MTILLASHTFSAPIFSKDCTERGPVKSWVIAISIFAMMISPASTLSLPEALANIFSDIVGIFSNLSLMINVFV